jgi:hypothetical protein
MTERVTIHDVARCLPSIGRLREVCRALAALEIVRHPGAGSGSGPGSGVGPGSGSGPGWGAGSGAVSGAGGREHDFLRGWRTGADAAVRRTGGGDGYVIAFTCYGAIALGFDHESPMNPYASAPPVRTWPGVLDAVPPVFAPYVTEPPEFLAAEVPLVTACAWRTADDDRWRTGDGIAFPTVTTGTTGTTGTAGSAGSAGSAGVAAAAQPDGAGWLFALLADPVPEAYARESGLPVEAVRHAYELRPLDRESVAALNPAASGNFAVVAGELERIGYPVAG